MADRLKVSAARRSVLAAPTLGGASLALLFWWQSLPPERPKLVLFAKSLRTVGLEAPFVGANASESVAHIVSLTDGALIVGAKECNPIHSQP